MKPTTCTPFGSILMSLFVCLAVPACAQSGASTAVQSAKNQNLQAFKAASSRMAFEVASVKPNKSGGREYSNIPLLVPGSPFPSTGGLFSATNYSLMAYIIWAYDVPVDQATHLFSELPRWAAADPRFDIEARAPGNPTKAQVQLMMQSLLADRFKLAIHIETKDEPIYALILRNPGRTGPHLRPHVVDESCAAIHDPVPVPPAGPGEEFPPPCSSGVVAMQPTSPGRIRIGARGVTLEQIAGIFPLLRKVGVSLDRPVVERTSLNGNFDFAIEFTPQISGPLPPSTGSEPDATGPSFLEALQDQLGLKLESQTGPISIFVIDHIQEPSPN